MPKLRSLLTWLMASCSASETSFFSVGGYPIFLSSEIESLRVVGTHGIHRREVGGKSRGENHQKPDSEYDLIDSHCITILSSAVFHVIGGCCSG